MKKLVPLSLVLLSILTIGLMVGCDNATAPGGQQQRQPSSIEVRATHTDIVGYKGENRSETITAIARDNQGVAIPGVNIDFSIQNPQTFRGTIAESAADSVSNERGEVNATYSVVINQTADVVIVATSGNVTGRITLHVVESAAKIGSLTLDPARTVLAAPPNRSSSRQIVATLVDTSGLAIPGMQIRFSTNPASMGSVDSDTGTTDASGKVYRMFNSIVNKYGVCQVRAQVGDTIGTATIEVRPVATPAFISVSSPTPTLQGAAGANLQMTLEAIVTDSNRIGVPSAKIDWQVRPIVDGGATFGQVYGADTTDATGKAVATFNSLGGIGKLRIRAVVLSTGDEVEVEGIAAETTIETQRISSQINALTVRAAPSILDLPPDSLGISTIRAQVVDINNVGLRNIQVNFTTNLGSLAFITPTDSAGVATAQFRSNYETGTATIVATIPGTPFEATTSIRVKTTDLLFGTIDITSDVEFIYADNGLTVANIKATLKDQDNQALVGKQVTFHCPLGAINSPVTTDTLGIASATFVDQGVPSLDDNDNPVPVWIKAKYRPLSIEDSVAVTIRPRNPVSLITLVANKQSVQAGSGDSVAVRATCFLQSGAFAPSGTIVTFEVDNANGFFTLQTVPVGEFGVANSFYIPGNFVGTAVLRAKVVNDPGGPENTVSSNDVEITLLSGPPSSIRLTAMPNVLNTNDPAAFATITAMVTDTSGNPVRQGELVRFETDKGDVTPSALTDSLGRGIGRLTAGVESGMAVVTGRVTTPGGGVIEATVTVTFLAGYPNVIQLTADPLQIAVAGTGGVSTSTLRATVLDANGNSVERTSVVVFQLLNEPAPPQGCNINNRGDLDSARTANGLAVVSVNSGEEIGGILIRAYTWRDPDSSSAGIDGRPRTDTVSVVISTIAVVAGPPFQLDIDVNDDGNDAGGGTWEIPVSARVWDNHRNPVADRVPVVFTVDPEIASVDPGYTGNDIGSGVTPGIAYSFLRYHSLNTFSPLTISAEVQAPRGVITGDRAHTLPLQDGVLQLQVDPQNWMFDRDRPNDTCLVRCWAILYDGHQITINNAPILFRADRARFYWKNLRLNGRYIPFFPEVARRFTGLVNQENNEPRGTATVYWRAIMDDVYLDPFTLEVTVHVEAAVEGYDVSADPAFIFCTRH